MKNPESTSESPENLVPGFLHTVYFWLKKPADPSDRQRFETSLRKFISRSRFIKTRYIGVPAKTDRAVIDQSYTYCLSLTFENKADQDKYQEEDVHLIFIKESEMLWEKVLVYDSESILQSPFS